MSFWVGSLKNSKTQRPREPCELPAHNPFWVFWGSMQQAISLKGGAIQLGAQKITTVPGFPTRLQRPLTAVKAELTDLQDILEGSFFPLCGHGSDYQHLRETGYRYCSMENVACRSLPVSFPPDLIDMYYSNDRSFRFPYQRKIM